MGITTNMWGPFFTVDQDISHLGIYLFMNKFKLDLKESIGLQLNGHRRIVITHDSSTNKKSENSNTHESIMS